MPIIISWVVEKQTYYPVFDYGTEKYTIRDNLIYAITYLPGTAKTLPFAIKMDDSLEVMLKKIASPPSQRFDDLGVIEFRKINIGNQLCEIDLKFKNNECKEITLELNK